MSVQLPTTETYDVPLSTIMTDFPGLEEMYRLVDETQCLLGTMSTLSQLTDEASIPLCPWHAVAIENVLQLAAASMEQRIKEMEQRVEEMKQRVVVFEHHFERLERQRGGTVTERTLEHNIDDEVDSAISA